MPLTRITCPECGAGLKSATGFAVGQTIGCPKCEADFTVEEPAREAAASRKPVRAVATRAEDEDDDRPRKKKRRPRDEDDADEAEWSYKSSWIRYAVLGVLLVVMVVLGYMLYQKRQREKEEARAQAQTQANTDDAPRPNFGPMPGAKGPNPGVQFARGPNPGFPGRNGVPVVPFTPGQPPPPGGPAPAGAPPGVFGPTPPAATQQGQQLVAGLTRRLAGTWEGTAPDGAVHRVEYRADGTYTHVRTAAGGEKRAAGTWQAVGLLGTRGLKLKRGDTPPLNVVFEDDELVHDTGTPGETVVLRKK